MTTTTPTVCIYCGRDLKTAQLLTLHLTASHPVHTRRLQERLTGGNKS